VGRGDRRNVRAVLVDLDDTIFDHSMTCRSAIAALRTEQPGLRRRPLQELWRLYLEMVNADFPRTRAYTGRPGLTAGEVRRARWAKIASVCGEQLSRAEAGRLASRYREHYERLSRAVPGAPELLRRLHAEVPVVVVTNNELAEQETKIRRLGVGAWIDGLVVSQAVGAAKPDRRIFEVALAQAGAPAERATMLGDSWESDIVGARGIGVHPVWFNRFDRAPGAGRAVPELRSLRPTLAARDLLLRRRAARRTADARGRPERVIAAGKLRRR